MKNLSKNPASPTEDASKDRVSLGKNSKPDWLKQAGRLAREAGRALKPGKLSGGTLGPISAGAHVNADGAKVDVDLKKRFHILSPKINFAPVININFGKD